MDILEPRRAVSILWRRKRRGDDVESQHRLLLRAWIEAIIHHALVRVPESGQRAFILDQLALLERDFKVKITIDDDFIVEISYLDLPL